MPLDTGSAYLFDVSGTQVAKLTACLWRVWHPVRL